MRWFRRKWQGKLFHFIYNALITSRPFFDKHRLERRERQCRNCKSGKKGELELFEMLQVFLCYDKIEEVEENCWEDNEQSFLSQIGRGKKSHLKTIRREMLQFTSVKLSDDIGIAEEWKAMHSLWSEKNKKFN